MAGLKRDLGLLSMMALGVSMVLGSGIFFAPSITAREFPDSRMVVALWLAGGLVAPTYWFMRARQARRAQSMPEAATDG